MRTLVAVFVVAILATPAAAQDAAPDPIARSRALVDQGAGLIVRAGQRTRPRLTNAEARAAFQAFADVKSLLAQSAHVRSGDDSLTPSQLIYAEATAWDALIRVKFSDARRDIPIAFRNHRVDEAPSGLHYCRINMDARPLPDYPDDALNEFGVGVVTLLIEFDPQGHSTRIQVAYAVGGQSFRDAVQEVVGRWHATAQNDGSCAIPELFFNSVDFYLN